MLRAHLQITVRIYQNILTREIDYGAERRAEVHLV